MTKLNQIVAVEKSTKEATNKATAPFFQDAKRPEVFAGLTKTYEPVDEDGEELPDESATVKLTVNEILDGFSKPMIRLLDVIATKETANTEAFGDVVVDGETLLERVPVSFLLQLEKQLSQEVRGLIQSLPVLDPAQTWTQSGASRVGIFESSEIKRHRTKKVQKPIVLYQATDKHPAQTQLITEDVVAGYWTEKKFSGAIPAQRKQELLDRVEKLVAAVKFAREQANDRTVTDAKVGETVFGYLFS